MSETTPPTGHNQPHADVLLGDVKRTLQAHFQHSTKAIKALHNFLTAVMRTCEYAHQNDDTRKEVELALYHAGISSRRDLATGRARVVSGDHLLRPHEGRAGR